MTAPSFPLFPTDLLVGGSSMDDQQFGVYVRLLCHQWIFGGLPNDEKKLVKLIEGDSISRVVLAKFRLEEDGLLRNKRMEIERGKMLSRCAITINTCITIPKSLEKDGFPLAWTDYRAYREQKGEPLTSMTAAQLLAKCERMGHKKATAAIRECIEKSRKNILEAHEMTGFNGKPITEPAKSAKPSGNDVDVALAKQFLAEPSNLSVDEQNASRAFLRTLSDSGIGGYFTPNEQMKIKKIT